ncbi:hypothetical protein uav_014 [Pseudomonas phage UAVern]|uniref:Uncharacterized protein n=1 Tax=Pseudomonas phage UAVern TaxID=2856997 RepID=A0A975UUK4_9CAUD|nr:hypothetical protein uav_014 [Pseudomonas phage UAVern]
METIVIKGATIDQKREILDGNKGQMFGVTWIKKDGTETHRVLKQWMNKALASGTKDVVQANPAAHNPDNYTAADPDKVAAGNPFPWVNVTLSKMKSCKVGGKEYKFED